MVWLHGTIEASVLEARNLPRKFISTQGHHKAAVIFDVCFSMPNRCLFGGVPAEAYVTIDFGETRRAHTGAINYSAEPQWAEEFIIPVADEVDEVGFTVKDSRMFGAVILGRAIMPVDQVIAGKIVTDWYELNTLIKDEKPSRKVQTTNAKDPPAIKVRLRFTPVKQDPEYNGGTKGDGGVPHTYFPLRKGCSLRLYNDAHQDPSGLPEIKLDNNMVYQTRGCFEDIYKAISDAKHFIYITGWSVYIELKLRRNGSKDEPTLGQLLKRKANEGVTVCLLVWDDKSSLNSPLITLNGMMATHDEHTRKFFRYSKVHCKLCPRRGSKTESLLQGLATGNMFTHHQKSLICDALPPSAPDPPPGGRRAADTWQQRLNDLWDDAGRRVKSWTAPRKKDGGPGGGPAGVGSGPDVLAGKRVVTAFVGGIDLCDGRYDTRDHCLFRTLDTVHEGDYHQACIPNATKDKGGPRQPWHDIHARLDGPIAWDVLHNFVQRWHKQAGLKRQYELLNLVKLPDLHIPQHARNLADEETDVGDPGVMTSNPSTDPESWSCQLFRSIDGSSAELPKNQHKRKDLAAGKGRVVDASIHAAYVHAIRRAKRFIYIENQYFIGGSHLYPDPDTNAGGATNLVPVEIAKKIVNKIRAGERFTAYLVLPMFPEGVPDSGSVQEVLHWQGRSIALMYRLIAEGLAEAGESAGGTDPTDYLQVFCLGNREPRREGEEEAEPPNPPAEDSPHGLAQKYRRFMIYVHSKLMIVDDEYIIAGSANINQRSLDGARDTELAFGAFQPGHRMPEGDDGKLPRGQVHGFRMSLWHEHTNQLEDTFLQPHSLECARRMKQLARDNWAAYAAEEVQELPGHLMWYPYSVDSDGAVTALDGEHFPDTNARVLGGKSGALPDLLTT